MTDSEARVGAIPVPVSELDADARQWLETEGVDLADERTTVVRPPTGPVSGVDVATRRGIVQIRYDAAEPVVRLNGPIGVDGLDTATFGRPWVIVSAPGKLVGTRYDTAGVACRAALRGFPWPESLPYDWERDFPTDLPEHTVSLPGSFVGEHGGGPDELVTFGAYERAPGRAAADDAAWRRSAEAALRADAVGEQSDQLAVEQMGRNFAWSGPPVVMRYVYGAAERPAQSRADLVAYVANVLGYLTTPNPETNAERIAHQIVTVVMLHLGADLGTALGVAAAESAEEDPPAEPEPISLWGHCDDDACPREHEIDDMGVRRHELPDDHPRVVALRAAKRAEGKS